MPSPVAFTEPSVAALDPSGRAAEHARSSRNFYRATFALWLLCTLLAITFIVETTVDEQRSGLDETTSDLRRSFEDRARANHAVLQGFAAYLEVLGSDQRDAAARYARNILPRFPHVYMLEIARELPAADRAAFEARQSLELGRPFRVTQFAYDGDRRWSAAGDKAVYYPLVFFEPELPVADDLMGLDIDSVDFLRAALRKADAAAEVVASESFRLVEGEPAYVMFQPVRRHAGDPASIFGGRLFAMLVVKADSLFDRKLLSQRSGRLSVYHADSPPQDPKRRLVDLGRIESDAGSLLLPLLRAEARVEATGQPFVIVAERQVRWSDVDSRLLLLVAGAAAIALWMLELLRRRQAASARALEASEAWLRAFFETANAGIFQADVDGILRVANARLGEMFGVEAAALIGCHYAELVRTDERDDARRLYADLVSGKIATSDVERFYRRPDGSEFAGFISGRRQVDPRGRAIGIIGIIIDVSAQRAAEEALRRERDFADRLIRNAPVIILLLDADGGILYANPFFAALTGYSLEEIRGRDWFSTFVPGRDRQRIRRVFDDITGAAGSAAPGSDSGGGVVNPILTRSGEEREIEWHSELMRDDAGVVSAVLAVGADVSARWRAERALRESGERLRFMVRSSSDILYLVGHDGVPRYASTVVERITGYSLAELEAPIRQFIHPDDWPRVRDNWRELVAEPERVARVEYRHRCKSGGWVWLEALARNFFEREGIGAVAVNARDIDERKRIEDELLGARTAAEAATLAKSEFLANMSHEIRTPMSAILGLGYLLERTELTPVQRDYIDKIGAATRSLQAIVHDILDFSKIESGYLELERVAFDLDEVLDELACVAGVAAEGKPIEINFVVAPAVPRRLVGDPLRLEQVLSNLIGNALKFTRDGEVRLEIDLDPAVDSGGITGGVGLRFAVADTGIGIAADVLGKLFEAFSQADASTTRRFGGTGLGLAICRRLVELMGGRIHVDSAPGIGSRFSFSLLFATEPEGEAVLPHPVAAAGAGVAVVLAVRHPSTRANVAALLAGAGFEPRPAASAAAAVAALQPPPQALLADAELLDDPALAAALADAAVPVLRLSADWVRGADPDRLPPALAGHVLKPVTRNALLDALRPGRGSQSPPPLPPRLSGLRVLVVEDSPVNRQVVSEILSSCGALAECAGDGAVALARLRSGAVFDVVLMDLQMPEMDGFEAARQIRAEPALAGLPVIALTANVLNATVERCRLAGMAMHLAKPVDPEHLCFTILRVLGRDAEAMAATPPAALPADPLFLGELPGIDLAEARTRMLGDAARLRRMLAAFAEGYGDYAEDIAAALAAQDGSRAARLAHDLVGAAATVGATALATAARALERALAGASGDAATTALLAALVEELARVLATAREISLTSSG